MACGGRQLIFARFRFALHDLVSPRFSLVRQVCRGASSLTYFARSARTYINSASSVRSRAFRAHCSLSENYSEMFSFYASIKRGSLIDSPFESRLLNGC
jgi:hypothetical protein